MYHHPVISLSAANPADHLRALDEVREFATTSMGRGGPHRWTFRMLSEPRLSQELQTMAHPRSVEGVDGITFQPCQLYEERSQDRCRMEHWSLPGGTWVFNAIFDGHVGHLTVDHAAHAIPAMVKNSLETYLTSSSRGSFTPSHIAKILSDAVVQFDQSVTSNFLNLFPGGPSSLQRMSDEQIRRIVDDRASGGRNYTTAVKCLQGTTALITLTDPGKNHLWILNLGDCQAILASPNSSGQWQATFTTVLHDGENYHELTRIKHEHPGEKDCARDNRVVGYLGPTRSIGDTWLKIPALYSQRVLLNLRHEWNVERPETYIARVRSPPYVSNTPDVHHIPLPKAGSGRPREMALMLCSDGLPDLCSQDQRSRPDLANHWARVIGRAMGSRHPGNIALRVLRDALGGDNAREVSKYLTVEMDEKWIDDVTVIVQRL